MYFIYILITVLILSFLIIVHEFGHYLAAKKIGVKVDEFAVGMGPAIYKKQGKETLFSIRLFPIGGYCSLQGETESRTEVVELLDGPAEIEIKDENLNPEKSFINKKTYQKIFVLIAGVTMNFITGYLIIMFCFLISGANFFSAITRSFGLFGQMFGLVFLGFKMLFSGEAGVNDLTGPIGLVEVVKDYYSYGLVTLLLFAAMISINLGIMNLLPIPALDGGQIVLTLFDKFKKSPATENLKNILIAGSYILLIGLAVFVAANDVIRIVN